MNPSRSLMALAVTLFCAASAWAVGPWLEVKAGAQSYFITKAVHDQLKAAKVGEERKLLEKPEGKDSGAVLRKKAANAYVVVKGNTETAVASVGPVTAPKKDAVVNANSGIVTDPAIASAVMSSANLDAAQRLSVGRMMNQLKSKNPAEYERMKAGGAASINAVIAKMAATLRTNKPNADGDVTKAYEALTQPQVGKGSMLTVALDDSNAPVVESGKGKKPDTVLGVADGDQQDPNAQSKDLLSVLTDVIGKNRAAADTDLSQRFTKYLLEEESGAYISAAVRRDAQRLKDIGGFVAAWVKEANSGDLAVLYAVMGSGGPAPAWVGDKDVGMLLEKAARLPKLKTYMSDWTKTAAQGARGQLARGSTEEVAAFFSNGGKESKTGGLLFASYRIIEESRTDADLKISILKNEEAPVVPNETGDGTSKIKDPATSFNFDGLYLRGGATGRIYAPGDKHSRDISVKLYTERVNGELVTKIGVWDITNKGNVFGQNFDISDSGGSTFALDDRKPGYPKYVLKYEPQKDGNTKVTLMREGGEAGGKIETTLGGLYTARAKQAADEGAPIMVGGKKFLTIGQGGSPAGVVMYPADTARRMAVGDVVVPELYAETTVRGQGRDLNKPGKQTLGQVDGKDYHLAFNSQLKYWQVGEGKGDEPKKEPSTTTTTGGGDNKTTGDNNTTTTTGGGEDIAAAEALLVSSGKYERNKEVQEGLDEKYRELVRVYSWVKKYENTDQVEARPINQRHVMIVPADINPQRSSHVPFLKNEADDMRRKKGEVRGIGKYLATTTDLYTAYFDVTKKSDNPNLIFHTDLECFIDEKKKTFCVRDMALLADAMGRGGFKAADVELVKARATKLIGSQPQYTIKNSWDENAGKPGPIVAVIIDKGTCVLFPTESPCSTVSNGGHDETKNKSVGPANAFDKLILAPPEDFATEPQTVDNAGNKETVHFMKLSDDKEAVLYANNKDAAKATTWYLMFNIKLRDGKKARTGFIPVFDSTVKFPGLDQLRFKGVALSARANAPDISATGELRRGYLPAKKQGVYYAVEEKGVKNPDSQLKYPNCVGPVLWWGIDQAKAQDACVENNL